jgi:bile acid:Na+ symporter, BASS family
VQAVLNYAIPAITVLILLAVGLDLTPADFARVRHQPRIVAGGMVGPLLLLPPLALLLIVVFSPTTDLRDGLLLVVACPIGGISNMYS